VTAAYDVRARAHACLKELAEVARLERLVTGELHLEDPNTDLAREVYKRLSRLYSLEKQIRRIEDELELILVSAGRGVHAEMVDDDSGD
jgi:hypothetical protein